MGQNLFAPPNVKGWLGGRAWLNSATLLARQNFAEAVAAGKLGTIRQPTPEGPQTVFVDTPPPDAPATPKPSGPPPEPPPVHDPVQVLKREKAAELADAVAFLVELLHGGDLPAAARERLLTFVKESPPRDEAGRNRRLREVVQ